MASLLAMPKRSGTGTGNRPKRPADPNQLAAAIVDEVTSEAEARPEKNPAAVSLGRLGGLKGGKARAAKLGKRRRSEIARNAANARWQNRKPT